MEKNFTTYDEQISIMKDRGIHIKSKKRTISILANHTYYSIINGYKDLFLFNYQNNIYKPNVEFEEIFSLYNFDNELRILFLKYILEIETNIKAKIAYQFSETYGYKNYLKIENFDTQTTKGNKKEKNIKQVLNLIKDFEGEIARSIGSHNAVSHYIIDNGYVPLWVLVKVITFGKISRFYGLMKQSDRQKISKQYQISDSELKNMLKMLSYVRNICAHNDRLYNYTSKNDYLANSKIHEEMNLLLKNGEISHGKKDLFAIIIISKYLLPSKEFKVFVNQIKKLVTKLEKNLHSISITDVLNCMGFPQNWEDIITVNK